MRGNQINIYDLDVVNTTIVMRELPYNPDTISICIHDLNAVTTDITMWAPCTHSGGASVEVFPGTGVLILTGYAPTVTASTAITVPRGQRVKVVRSFEA